MGWEVGEVLPSRAFSFFSGSQNAPIADQDRRGLSFCAHKNVFWRWIWGHFAQGLNLPHFNRPLITTLQKRFMLFSMFDFSPLHHVLN